MKKVLMIGLLAGTLFSLSGCEAPCNEDVLKERMQEVSEKIQEIAASGDMNKLMAVANFSKELNQLKGANQENLEPVCEAVDELLAELDDL